MADLHPEWIAHDYKGGLTVTLKEKYGTERIFRCNVVIKKNGHFILTDRDGVVADLPCGNWAIVALKHNE